MLGERKPCRLRPSKLRVAGPLTPWAVACRLLMPGTTLPLPRVPTVNGRLEPGTGRVWGLRCPDARAAVDLRLLTAMAASTAATKASLAARSSATSSQPSSSSWRPASATSLQVGGV